MASTRLTGIYPVLPAREVTTAADFYVHTLGFVVAFGDPSQADGYVGLRRDGIEIHLQFQFDKDFEAGTAGQACLRFETEDPDVLFNEWSGKGIIGPHTSLKDTTWGTREVTITDPNGNSLTFQRDL